jgi:rhamnulose-1-phosphate aldolase
MAAPHLCGTALLIKQGGAWMRDIARTPTEGLCLVQIDDRGESYTVRPANARPTSELASHVAAHNRLAACRPQDRAVLHTHPTDLVELTLLIPGRSELVRRLAGSGAARSRTLTDIVVAVPQARPGSKTLARTTAAVMRRSRGVIWPGHGMIATGTTLREALRIIELTNQAAAAVLGSGRSTLHAARLTPQASRVMRLEA